MNWNKWRDYRLGETEPDMLDELAELLSEYSNVGGYVPGSIKTPSKMKPHMMKYSNKEAQRFAEDDVKKMGKELNKASQRAIAIMLGSVKNGKYDAMDMIRAIKMGRGGDVSVGVPEMLRVLWAKVEKRFRKYLGGKKRRG